MRQSFSRESRLVWHIIQGVTCASWTLSIVMDVDRPSAKRSPPASSSSVKRKKLNLTSAELSELNAEMKNFVNRLKKCVKEWTGEDWSELLPLILSYLTQTLRNTSMESTLIAYSDVQSMLDKLDKDVLEQFSSDVLNAVNSEDWSDVITHRPYISYHQLLRS